MMRLERDYLKLRDGCFFNYYKKLRDYLIDKSSDSDSFIDDYFTKHDHLHCCAIEKIINSILKNCKNTSLLSDLEKFLLLCSIWSHDLGMLYNIATEYFKKNDLAYSPKEKRRFHDLISAWHLSENYRTIFNINAEDTLQRNFLDSELRSYIDIINIIIKYHRRASDINNCPKELFLGSEKVKCRLIACLLRLGDTLHIDSSRFDEKSYNLIEIGEFDRYARLHWLKSYIVSNIHLDPESQLVHVNIDLPEVSDNSDWNENIKNLEYFIIKDIQEDLLTVAETFRTYGLPVYLGVRCNINQIPGFNKKFAKEVLGVLNDLDLIFSPNSTRAIKKSLSSIKALGEIDENNYKKFYNQFDQLKKNLKRLYQEKPCHVGLGKIINELDSIELKPVESNVTNKYIDEIRNKLKDKANKIERERENCLNKIFSKENKGLSYLDTIKNIFLFGYSELVSRYLEEYAKINPGFLEDVNIFIFEGGSKRRYSNNNIMEYNDGIYYSVKLSRLGFKRIKILPDIEFASLLNKIEIYPNEIVDPFALAQKIENSSDTVSNLLCEKFTHDVKNLDSKNKDSRDKISLQNSCANLLNKAIYSDLSIYENLDEESKKEVDTKCNSICRSHPRTINHKKFIKNKLSLIKIYSDWIEDYKEPCENSVLLFGANGVDPNLFSLKLEDFNGQPPVQQDSGGKFSINEKLIEFFTNNGFPLTKEDIVEKVEDSTNTWKIIDKDKSFYIYRITVSDEKININGLNFGYCGHSAGHLSLAIVANEFKIPVIVVADSYKFGNINWNLLATRETDWLTTQDNFLKDIKDHEIDLINYREDMIPPHLITMIISDAFPPSESKKTNLREYCNKRFAHMLLKSDSSKEGESS